MHEPVLGGGGLRRAVREHQGHFHGQARTLRVQRQLAVLGDLPDGDTAETPGGAAVPRVCCLLLAGIRGAVHARRPSHPLLAGRQAGCTVRP